MKELSLYILDIVQNSVKARAKNIGIYLVETDDTMRITVTDDGCGMTAETVSMVRNPFVTSRTTRKVGLGIPFFEEAAQLTGGSLTLTSRDEEKYPDNHGTEISALFNKKHIDYTPLGDIVSTIVTLVQGSGDIDYIYSHEVNGERFELSTKEIKKTLGNVPISGFEVLEFLNGYISEQEELLNKK